MPQNAVNGGVETGWDNYAKSLDNMGLQEMLAVYQAAYDTYLANQ